MIHIHRDSSSEFAAWVIGIMSPYFHLFPMNDLAESSAVIKQQIDASRIEGMRGHDTYSRLVALDDSFFDARIERRRPHRRPVKIEIPTVSPPP
jgi:hypothetical protein